MFPVAGRQEHLFSLENIDAFIKGLPTQIVTEHLCFQMAHHSHSSLCKRVVSAKQQLKLNHLSVCLSTLPITSAQYLG